MADSESLPGGVTVVGLGYVGLPLALAFAKKLPTTGFDLDAPRVDGLRAGIDHNSEVDSATILSSNLTLTTDVSCIADAEFIVVTVPTPVTDDHEPDLSLLASVSASIGDQLRGRSEGLPAPIVVYESTTYPGCTEEFCGPIIERESGLRSGEGFFLGYSPERTNFGDAEHTLETVVKVVSGQTSAVAARVAETYGLIAKAGTHMAQSIKTAEASKVIENVQRDLNIALFNELSIIFDRMGIQSSDVFDAAATKWNFHRYQPGLVGGHCIPVDPYYLAYAAARTGYDADVVLTGRAINEGMPEYVAEKVESLALGRGSEPDSARVLVLGATFKKNVADTRNSKAIVLAELLAGRFGVVHVYDPYFDPEDGLERRFEVVGDPAGSGREYDLVVVAVGHSEFDVLEDQLPELLSPGGFVFDLTGTLAQNEKIASTTSVWSL